MEVLSPVPRPTGLLAFQQMLDRPSSSLLAHHLPCDLLVCGCSCPFVYTKASVPAQILSVWEIAAFFIWQVYDTPSRDLIAPLLTVAPNEDLLCAQ